MKTVYLCFPGGKHKVLTMSYDDGTVADRKLVSIFNKYGIKGTFHLNGGLFANEGVRSRITKEEAKELYKGHEISCHTFTHPTIARCPIETVARQVIEDRIALEEIAGYPVRGMSYPNGSLSDKIVDLLPGLGIEYSRTVVSTFGFGMPDDFLRWNATCHHNKNLLELGNQFAALNKTQYLYMMYVWGHSYEFDNDNNWDLIEDFCKMLGGRDDIWYATNMEIVEYMKASESVRFSAKGDMAKNCSCLDMWYSYDGKMFMIPAGQTVKFE